MSWAVDVGMVGTSFVVDGVEVLGQRGGLEKYRRTGSTFGVPLLYPWANRLDRRIDSPLVRHDPNGLAIHGILAASPRWETVRESNGHLAVRLDFGAHSDYLDVFPHPHVIEVETTTEDRMMRVVTRVVPTQDSPVPVAFGWHPYLQIPGIPREEWDLTLPVTDHLVLDDRKLPTGEIRPVEYPQPLPLEDRDFDDGYAGLPDGARFAVTGGSRTIEVVFERGYPFGQVFAPPGEEVVCFEPMTAPTNALESGHGLRVVGPGESFEAAFTIGVTP